MPVVATALFACASLTHAQSPVDTFLAALRTDIRNGDRAAVAAAIQYPMTVALGGVRVPFADAASLLERYDDIFTPALLDTMARNLVIQRIGQQWRITAIAVPPSLAVEQSGVRRQADSTGPGNAARGSRSPGPTRVGIRGGPRPTQFSGAILPGGADLYLLWVPKGGVLEVRLNRVRGREALVRVVHARTGAPFNPRLADGARVVTGVAPESADYRIEVRRSEGLDQAPLPYVVSLTLR